MEKIVGSTPCGDLLRKTVEEADLLMQTLHVLEGKEQVVSGMCRELRVEFHRIQNGLEYLKSISTEQKLQICEIKKYLAQVETTQKQIDHIEKNIPIHFTCSLQVNAEINGKLNDVKSDECDSDSLEAIEDIKPVPQVKKTTHKPQVDVFCPTMAFLTRAEFDGMSSYMRGSSNLSYDAVNTFISTFNVALTNKYRLLAMPKNKIQERLLHSRYKTEESRDTKGEYFVTEEDLKNTGQMKAYKTTKSLLSILRSFKRMREIRGQGFIRYAVIA